VNSKQIVAIVGVIALVVILVYPAFSTSNVSVLVQASKISNADHVFITMNSVWLHQAGGSSTDGWKLVSNQTQSIDLVSLQNSAQLLAKGQVPLSNYDAIRISVSTVNWVYNKTSTQLQAESSQISTTLQFTATAGRDTSITLLIGGNQEQIQGTQLFVSSVNATVTSH
jgi:hypothetical protein